MSQFQSSHSSYQEPGISPIEWERQSTEVWHWVDTDIKMIWQESNSSHHKSDKTKITNTYEKIFLKKVLSKEIEHTKKTKMEILELKNN